MPMVELQLFLNQTYWMQLYDLSILLAVTGRDLTWHSGQPSPTSVLASLSRPSQSLRVNAWW